MVRKFALILLLLTAGLPLIAEENREEPIPKWVSSNDNRYELLLNSSYTNKIADRRNFIAARMPGIPATHLTLLQQSPNTTVFAFSIPIPDSHNLTIDKLLITLNEQLADLKNVRYSITKEERSLARATYAIHQMVDERNSYEYCMLQLTLHSVDTICANGERNQEELIAIIDSIQIK